MNSDELEVKVFLTYLGFNVNRIPESGSKTCDFIVNDSVDSYLIEVKTRENDKTLKKELYHNKFALKTEPIGRTEKLRKIIRESLRQLDAIEKEPTDTYKIVWFVIKRKDDEEFVFEQIRATIYGVEQIVFWPENATNPIDHDCLYFTHSDFFKNKHLDAVMVELVGGFTLCVNDKANRYSKFKHTKLYTILENNGVLDPSLLEGQPGYFIADCNIDRNSEDEVLKYVKEKYSLDGLVVNLVFKKHTAYAVVPNKIKK